MLAKERTHPAAKIFKPLEVVQRGSTRQGHDHPPAGFKSCKILEQAGGTLSWLGCSFWTVVPELLKAGDIYPADMVGRSLGRFGHQRCAEKLEEPWLGFLTF